MTDLLFLLFINLTVTGAVCHIVIGPYFFKKRLKIFRLKAAGVKHSKSYEA